MFSFFLDLKLPLRCIYKKNREARDMYGKRLILG